MDGLRLCARYSYMPNSLGYCGPPNANTKILDYVFSGDADIRPILIEFDALHPYLKLLAGANGIVDEFDERVVEALWIGNELLDKVSAKDIRKMMTDEFKGYLPEKLLTYLAKKVPEGVVPHHSFHVLHLQTVTGVIERSLENQDNCRVSWGRVVEKGDKLAVATQELTVEEGGYALTPRVREVNYQVGGRTFTDADEGDVVSIHWGLAVEKLSPRRVRKLEEYTNLNLKVLKPLFHNKTAFLSLNSK
jgi:hypothetical protein